MAPVKSPSVPGFALWRCPVRQAMRQKVRQNSKHAERCGQLLMAVAEESSPQMDPVAEVSIVGDDERHRVSVFYSSHWEKVFLHGSVAGGEWTDHRCSRLSSAGGNVRVAHVNAVDRRQADEAHSPLLEFVMHNGQGEYDKAENDDNFKALKAGGYRLEDGKMYEIRGDPIMLVSDLDDTMFGDDEASREFKYFWERDARLRGSCLVYNTGRSLDKWLSLWKEKHWCLASPDILITSVGTKVYKADTDSFQGWELDEVFNKQLDKGWDLHTVREAAYAALAAVGKEQMHFRPPEEQNEHKVTCGVKSMVADRVKEYINLKLKHQNVNARVVLSGRGEWRFLDVVSKQAGKLAALEYVRKQQGFSHSNTIACGDSGNDKDMLSGTNRAIVVANAEPDLKEWLLQEKAEIAGKERLYVAERNMARGILEGIVHFGF